MIPALRLIAVFLFFLPFPAKADTAQDAKRWAQEAGPLILSYDAARHDEIMALKKALFTESGYKDFQKISKKDSSKALEKYRPNISESDVAKFCATNVHALKDGWQVDAEIVFYKKGGLRADRPKKEYNRLDDMKIMDGILIGREPVARSFTYQTATFVLEETKNKKFLIRQYSAVPASAMGFQNCQTRREIEEKLEYIENTEEDYQRIKFLIDQQSVEMQKKRQKLLQELSGQ